MEIASERRKNRKLTRERRLRLGRKDDKFCRRLRSIRNNRRKGKLLAEGKMVRLSAESGPPPVISRAETKREKKECGPLRKCRHFQRMREQHGTSSKNREGSIS